MIQLTIYIDDITTVMSVFTHIRLYTSDSEDGIYTHLDYIALLASTTTYGYTHVEGTSDTWYKSSYWSASTESSLSDAVRGVDAELYHYPTYPNEVSFSSSEKTIIRKIRRLIGDLEGLDRLYIDCSDDDLSCSYIHSDAKTVDIGEKSWPVYVTLNGEEKTNLDDPYVQGYQFITFSGTLSSTDVIDVWYYTFKFSDREIYEAYSDTLIPPWLTANTVTQDHLILQSAIDLLESMTSADIVDDGAVVKDNLSSYDPSPGLEERHRTIERLRKQLDALVKQYMMSGLTGVLVD